MDRIALLQLLAKAEARVAAGEELIARQRSILATLHRDGHESSKGELVLVKLEELQRVHIAERERLKAKLTAG